jgi:uncharacterized protein
MHLVLEYALADDYVERFVAEDPYVVHGLVTGWAIRVWNVVVG